jgi:co-chaperonin GroES (HSP10)
MLQVVGHRVLVRPDPVETKTQSGIVLVKDERLYREATMSGEVVQIGESAWVGFADNKPWCQVGDKIIYARHTGKFVTDPDTEEELYVINDEDVQVIVKQKEKDDRPSE